MQYVLISDVGLKEFTKATSEFAFGKDSSLLKDQRVPHIFCDPR